MDDCESGGERTQSEFLCPGCGRPLNIVLNSTMCFAEAQVYCDECERDYQAGRGKWADRKKTSRVVAIFTGRDT